MNWQMWSRQSTSKEEKKEIACRHQKAYLSRNLFYPECGSCLITECTFNYDQWKWDIRVLIAKTNPKEPCMPWISDQSHTWFAFVCHGGGFGRILKPWGTETIPVRYCLFSLQTCHFYFLCPSSTCFPLELCCQSYQMQQLPITLKHYSPTSALRLANPVGFRKQLARGNANKVQH